MSIDTCQESNAEFWAVPSDAWSLLYERLRTNSERQGAAEVFGAAAAGGSIYRWGLAVAKSVDCDPVTLAMTRMATDAAIGKKLREQIDLPAAAESFVEWMQTTDDLTALESSAVVTWAAALPGLSRRLEPEIFRGLFQSLVQLRESVLQRCDPSSTSHLIIGAELGLTLAWRCHGAAVAKGLRSSSIRALKQWGQQEDESLSAALEKPLESRMVLASAIRSHRLLLETTKRRWPGKTNRLVKRLATWVIAMTTRSGSSVLSGAVAKQLRDDTKKNGLLVAACQTDPESLTGALSAALGRAPSGGRLAWQVSLPETMHHDDDAKLAVMFPDWDVRRGRTHIDYSADDVCIEVFAGRADVIKGAWQTMIQTDGAQQRPDGKWTEICEYSDDDIHYLEIEQPWSDGLLLQRQFMLVRDDRCLLLADSIIPQSDNSPLPQRIEYTSRLPLPDSVQFHSEERTREGFLADKTARALVFPLSASEWTIGPTDTNIDQSPDGCLVLSSSGANRLYVPLWFDFQKRRFKRRRTWRQLTVADQLQIVDRDQAVAYRVQVGSEQWVVYRSLAQRACRSFLGKHMIADFFSSRFDPEDGGHEALVTVDDDEHGE